MQVQVTMWHMHQVLHKLHKERRCAGFVLEIIWPMFVHTEIKFPVINGTIIPWSHTIHFLRAHMTLCQRRRKQHKHWGNHTTVENQHQENENSGDTG